MPDEPNNINNNDDNRPSISDDEMSSLAKIEATSLEPDDVREQVPSSSSPADSSSAQNNTPVANVPKPWLNEETHHKRKNIILLVVSITLLITGLGGWGAYAFWYQNPYKAVSDAIIGALSATTTKASGYTAIVDENAEYRLNFVADAGYKEGYDVDTRGVVTPEEGDKLSLEAKLRSNEKGDSFFRVDKLMELFDIFKDSMSAGLEAEGYTKSEIKQYEAYYEQAFVPIIEKIDGKWFVFTAEDIKDFEKNSGSAGSFECTQRVSTGLSKNPEKLEEMAQKYVENSFLTIDQELGTVDGMQGYVVGISVDKLEGFLAAIKDTKYYKELKACAKDENTYFDDINADDFENINTETWIDPWTHELKRINGAKTTGRGTNSSTIKWEINFRFNQPLTVETPQDTTPIDTLLPDFGDITNSVTSILNTQSSQEKA